MKAGSILLKKLLNFGCKTCNKYHSCIACGASILAETGDMTKKPDYICEMTEEYIKLLSPHRK